MGGGKGSKQKFPVADYFMSLHFGICKGPLDSINQIFVKELPVWCGQIYSSQSIDVDLPDLFGGDKKEGGVRGTMECYFGTTNQVMTEATATRYGKTPTTMPGYRGLANILFRGKGDGGFKWIANNPYMPGAWVNATRIPKSLSTDFAFIYSGPPDYLDKKVAPGVTVNATTFVSIETLGWTIADVDAGLIVCSMTQKVGFKGVGLGEGLAMSGFNGVEYQCYRDDGAGGVGTLIAGSREADSGIVSPSGVKTISAVLPAGTRHVRFKPSATATYPIFSDMTVSDADYSTAKMIYGPSYCTIKNHLGILPDANPAHMIYEALNDRDWGMGAPRTAFDIPSFMAAAETFYTEKFGLSIIWTDQTEIEKYVSEILDHVQATLFIHPRTGLWTLIPFRKDYVTAGLPVLSPANCKASNRQRKALGETVNEIVVSWTNPNNEQEETITFQDLGNISAQGGVVSATRNYYGVRNQNLANKIGQRDIRSASYPLFGCDIVADRSMSFLAPGSVVKFTWPEDGISEMILRVMKVDYGKPGDSGIKLSVLEDVFGLEMTEYTSVQESLWEDPNAVVAPMDYTEFLTAPLPLLLRAGVPLADLSDDDYPAVAVSVLSKRQTGGVEVVRIMGPVVKPNGDVVQEVVGSFLPTASNLSTTRIVDEVSTYLTDEQLSRFCGSTQPALGNFLHIEGPDGDRSSEIVMLDAIVDGKWKIARGMFDTVIRDWTIGTRVWFLGDYIPAIDPTERAVGVPAAYRLLPKSSGGTLAYADAPVLSFTPTRRPYAPFRPSDVNLVPVGGTPLTPNPVVLANPGAESGLTGWTQTNVVSIASVSYTETLLPKTGTKFFACANGVASASMEQLLSFPLTSWERVDSGNMEMSVRWWQAGFDSISDPARVEVDFYDAADVLISTYTSPDIFGGAQVWAFKNIMFVAPPLARNYVFRFVMTRTVGSNLNCHIDDIDFNLSAGQFPSFGFTGTEVPTSITVTWANRNRLNEDTLAKRWTEATVTPEVGQTTTVRVVDSVTGTVETETTGLTGTSFSLTLGALLNYRFYRVEVIAVRDGFESIQAAYREIQVVQLGWGNNYGFDYGENDGG